MGNDGGSIPTRRELVKEAAKALTSSQIKEVQAEQQEYAWSHDPLTRKPLAQPVVSDSAGTLYNKDSIIEFLLTDDADAAKAEKDRILDGRVKALKDVVEVRFEVADGRREVLGGSEGANGATGRTEVWMCPITGRELGPGSKAVYLVPCGHAFAGSVVREVEGRSCLQCNTAYAENDAIPILPTAAADVARLALRAKTLRDKGLTHALKKAPGSKKRKKGGEKEGDGQIGADADAAVVAGDGAKAKEKEMSGDEAKKPDSRTEKRKTRSSAPSASIKNSATASLTRKVLEEQEERNKRRKLGQNENVKSLFSKGSAKPSAANSADYMTRGFSIAK